MTSHVTPVLFAWVLVNQAGVPIPVVPSLVAVGALSAHAGTGVLSAVAVTVGAALLADVLWYGLGRWHGRQALAVVARISRSSAAHVDCAERRFRAHQLAFLFGSRFIPELNPVAAGMAGVTGMRPGRYLPVAATSALAWALAWTGAGYALGNATRQAPVPLGSIVIPLILAGAILAVGLTLKHRRRRAMVCCSQCSRRPAERQTGCDPSPPSTVQSVRRKGP
jgi:membrane protein DedA with SNARE-associated domain